MSIYFDQNITKKLCTNYRFSKNFFKQQFKPHPKLIFTPRTLIELSGLKIKDCLKERIEYKPDFSDLLLKQSGKSQIFKAWNYYYENNIKGNIFTILKNNLNKQKQYVKTKHGYFIFHSYLEYLNSMKGIEDIPYSISCDRVSALPLESFRDKNTYFHIYNLACHFLSINPHIPCLRLFIKSYKRLPPTTSQREKEEFRKPVKELIETSDLKQNGDLVDTEMIQFAFLGYGNTPVHFYTQDSANIIKNRLALFYMLFNRAKLQTQKLLNSKAGTPTLKEGISLEAIRRVSNLKFKLGKFSIIDDLGNIKDTIDVTSLLYKDWKVSREENNVKSIPELQV